MLFRGPIGDTVMAAVRLKAVHISLPHFPPSSFTSLPLHNTKTLTPTRISRKTKTMSKSTSPPKPKIIDSHLHIWASPQQAANEYPYSPGNEPTLPGSLDFLLQCMEQAGVDGALIVQPINHKFDHSLVTRSLTITSIIYLLDNANCSLICFSVLKKYPSKFVGCCLANPAEDGSGIKQLEHLILKDGYRAVRFNPYLWPPGEKMTNEVGKAMFAIAGEHGVPVGFMCMKGLSLHITEIEELCSEFPSTVVLLDHLAFCKSPTNDEERETFSRLLKLSRFPQVYVKFSAIFRVSRKQFPYEDTSLLLSEVVTSYGANRVMWGSDFPYVVPECGYKEAKEAVTHIADKIPLQSSDLEWIMGRSVMELFSGSWLAS